MINDKQKILKSFVNDTFKIVVFPNLLCFINSYEISFTFFLQASSMSSKSFMDPERYGKMRKKILIVAV